MYEQHFPPRYVYLPGGNVKSKYTPISGFLHKEYFLLTRLKLVVIFVKN